MGGIRSTGGLVEYGNTEERGYLAQPNRKGPVVQLVQVDNMERCQFEAMFTVPDVEPDRYRMPMCRT